MATIKQRKAIRKISIGKQRRARGAKKPTGRAPIVPVAVVKTDSFLKGQISAKARAGLFERQTRRRSVVDRERPQARRSFKGIPQGTIFEEKSVNSSWVTKIALVMWRGQPALGVSFKSGVSVVYRTTSEADYQRMATAASKGKFIWATLYHGIPGAGAPYTIVGDV